MNASWKDITIVYGMLNASDTAQYIKVEKAFLDPKTNALVIAQIPDSIFYKNLTVDLEEFSNGNLVKTINLTKIDGNLDGHPKQGGIFAGSPNWLYKTKQTINQNSVYKVRVTQTDNGKIVSAQTAIVNDFNVLVPGFSQPIFFNPGHKSNVNWKSAKDGKVYGLTVRINYVSMVKADTTIKVYQHADWAIFNDKVVNDITGNQNEDEYIESTTFYEFLANHLIPSTDTVRRAINMTYIFSVAGDEFNTYTLVNQSALGLTSGSVKPAYTNVENGTGLFSSRFNKNIINVPFDSRTIDTLACHSLTKSLKFLNHLNVTCF